LKSRRIPKIAAFILATKNKKRQAFRHDEIRFQERLFYDKLTICSRETRRKINVEIFTNQRERQGQILKADRTVTDTVF
jgi:hypothetical protein